MPRPHKPPRRRVLRRRRGSVLVNTVVMLPVVFGVMMVAVDSGQIFLAKSSLQAAADATARYGGLSLPHRHSVDGAVDEARTDHRVAGAAPSVREVRIGEWDGERKQLDTRGKLDNCDAVELTLSSKVDLLVAPILGISQSGVNASATVLCRRIPGGLGLVALSELEVDGSISLESYDSREGSFLESTAGAGNHNFSGWSNGNIEMRNGVNVWGDLMMDPDAHLVMNDAYFGGDGKRKVLDLDLDLEHELVPKRAIKMGNTDFTSGHYKLPGGSYWFAEFEIFKDATVEFTGPTELFLRGIAHIEGNIITHDNNPSNLRLVQTSAAPVNITSPASGPGDKPNWAMDIYSPLGQVNIDGPLNLFGRVQAKKVKLTNDVDFYMDEALCKKDTGIVFVSLVN